MTALTQIPLAAIDCMPVIAGTPIFRLANQYLNMEFNNNSLSKNIIMMFRDNLGRVLGLSAHQEVGRGNPIRQGFNKPLSTVVFFCHSKIKAVSNRLHSVMAGLLLGNSKELSHLVAVFPPLLINPAAYVVENISSGLHPQTRTTAMNTTSMGTNSPELSNQTQTEFKDAAIALCGGTAFLFLPNPSPTTLSIIIAKCERLLIAAKSLQTEGGVA